MRPRKWCIVLCLMPLALAGLSAAAGAAAHNSRTQRSAADTWNAAWVSLPVASLYYYGKPRVKPTRFEMLEASGWYVLQAKNITWRGWTSSTTSGSGEWRRCRVGVLRCYRWRPLMLELTDLELDCAEPPKSELLLAGALPPLAAIPRYAPALPLYHGLRMWMRSYDPTTGPYTERAEMLLQPCAGPPLTHPPRNCDEPGPLWLFSNLPQCRGDEDTPLYPLDCDELVHDWWWSLVCPRQPVDDE